MNERLLLLSKITKIKELQNNMLKSQFTTTNEMNTIESQQFLQDNQQTQVINNYTTDANVEDEFGDAKQEGVARQL